MELALSHFQSSYDHHKDLHSFPTRRSSDLLWVCKLLMLICILTKNVITSCSVTMMLFLHLEVKPLNEEITRSEERFSRNAETDLVCCPLHEKKNAFAAVDLGKFQTIEYYLK